MNLSEALKDADELRSVRDPELVLLKGHLLLERCLVAVVAARLRCAEENVPNLKFGALVDLGFSDPEDRKALIWLNDLRNAVAHEFGALDTPRFEKLIQRFDLPWPTGTLERCMVLEQLLLRFMHVTVLRTVAENFAPGEQTDDETIVELAAAPRAVLARNEENLASMRDAEWEQLVKKLRPGWQNAQ
jgi:hypothetical protein